MSWHFTFEIRMCNICLFQMFGASILVLRMCRSQIWNVKCHNILKPLITPEIGFEKKRSEREIRKSKSFSMSQEKKEKWRKRSQGLIEKIEADFFECNWEPPFQWQETKLENWYDPRQKGYVLILQTSILYNVQIVWIHLCKWLYFVEVYYMQLFLQSQ